MRIYTTAHICDQFHQCSKHSFYVHRPQKCIKDSQFVSFFTLLGFAHVKAACRTLMKLTRVEFWNYFLLTAFSNKSVLLSFFVFLCFHFGVTLFWKKEIGAKPDHNMLVKLHIVCTLSAPMLMENMCILHIILKQKKISHLTFYVHLSKRFKLFFDIFP